MKHRFEGNIYLLGFSGSGKSTVAPILAKKLNCAFFDTDQWVENETRKSISQIFAEEGEESFRRQEMKCFEIVAQMRQFVVAAGGGTVLYSKNWLNMKKSGLTVYFRCTPELLFERIKADETRPLLAGTEEERFDKIKNLLTIRAPYYEYADIIIEVVPAESVEIFAERLFQRLEEYI